MQKLLGVLAVILCVFLPSLASAQSGQDCANAASTTINPYITTDLSQFSASGEISAGLGCPGTKRVEVFLYGITGTCNWMGGTWDPGLGSCVKEATGQGFSNSYARAGLEANRNTNFFQGWWDAEAHYYYRDGSTWYQAGPWKRAGAYGVYQQAAADCNDPANQNLPECGSPIVIPINPEGKIKLTSVADGVLFDIDGDGVKEHMAWTKPNAAVAFLALDRNGNGKIDNGTELFGDHTLPDQPHGFAALAALAHADVPPDQWDGQVDTEPLFAKLLLWHDRNQDGISQKRELIPASQILKSVGLGCNPSRRQDQFGNLFALRGFAYYVDGQMRHIFDVFLRRENVPAATP